MPWVSNSEWEQVEKMQIILKDNRERIEHLESAIGTLFARALGEHSTLLAPSFSRIYRAIREAEGSLYKEDAMSYRQLPEDCRKGHKKKP